MGFRHIPATLVSLMIIAVAASCPALGDLIQGDVEVLKTAALQSKANYESLLTWKGEAIEEIRATQREEGYDHLIRNRVTFAYDQVRNAVRWNKDPQEQHLVVGGTPEEDPILYRFNSNMVIDDKTYAYSSLGWTADGKRTYDLIVGGPAYARDWDAFHFDPRRLLAEPVSERPIHERLMSLYNNARRPEDEQSKARKYECHVKRAGELVTVEVQLTPDPNAARMIRREVFDLSRGGNLVECYIKGPGTTENVHTYEYEEKSGVWIPKSYKWVNISPREKGDFKTTRLVKWERSAVNVPFEEDEFSLEKLGVKPGDTITDYRIGMVYTYRGEPGDSELLSPAYLTVKDVNAPNLGVKTPLARVPKKTRAGADANLPAPEGTNTGPNAGSSTPERRKVIADAYNTHAYRLLLIIAIVAAVGGIVYKLSHRFRKE